MVLLSMVISLFIGIQDPIIQKFTVRIAAGYLSQKTGAEIKIGRLYIAPDFSIHIKDFSAKDLKDNYLAKIGNLRTRLYIQDLLEGRIHLGDVELDDTEANLIKYQGSSGFNFQFILDAFPSDPNKKESEGATEIRIDKVKLKNIKFQLWDQNRANLQKTLDNRMDYAHLALEDINLDAEDIAIIGDSIHSTINNLTAIDICGFQLKQFKGIANVSPSGILVDDLHIQTNNSLLHMDLHMLYSGFDDISEFVDSVYFDTKIYPTDILLSDIGFFADVMYKMPNRVFFETRFIGPIENFRVEDFIVQFGKETQLEANLSMHPLDFFDGMHTLNIRRCHYNYDDINNFYIPGNSITIPLPESIKGMGSGNLTFDFRGSYNDFIAQAGLTSGIGDINVSFTMDKQSEAQTLFSGLVDAQHINIGAIANAPDIVGSIDLQAEIKGKSLKGHGIELDINGDASNAFVLRNSIDEIKLNGQLSEKQFQGLISIKDDDLDLDFNGLANFNNAKSPHGDFHVNINKADLKNLNLLKNDTIATLSTTITANMVGFNLDDLEGSLSIDGTTFTNGSGRHTMEHLYANIVNDEWMQRRINIICDFFSYEMAGLIDFASLPMAMKAYIDSYTHIPQWEDALNAYRNMKGKKEQDFFVKLNITNPAPLTQLLMPKLQLAKNTTLNGTFTSRSNTLNMTLRSKQVNFGNIQFVDFEGKNLSTPWNSIARINIDHLIMRDGTKHDSTQLGLENIILEGRLQNDSIFADLKWDDEDSNDHNRANIKTAIVPTIDGGRFNIRSADLLINDSIWNIDPKNMIVFGGDDIEIRHLSFFNNNQKFTVDGKVPYYNTDTINIKFKDFDVSSFDLIFKGAGFDLNGFIDGDAQISDLKGSPSVISNISIKSLEFNREPFGDAVIDSYWDNLNNSLYVDASLINQETPSFRLYGNYNARQKKDKLNFKLDLNEFRISILSPFLQGIVSRMQGLGNGAFNISGSLQEPNVEGELSIDDGGCQIEFLKTYYTFNPTIKITNSSIDLNNMILTDTLGNSAKVIGSISHNHFKDLYLDITLLPNNFLALATSMKDSPSYFGSAIADGTVEVKGAINDIKLKIRALTKRGTRITIPLGGASSVKNNDFIVFVAPEDDLVENIAPEATPKKRKSAFDIDLGVDVTDDARIKILLPSNIGSLDATGAGNIKIGVNSSGDFTLFGDYLIDNGKLQINYNSILNKNLKIQKGGTISWVGDPVKGTINVTGIYSTTASISSLGLGADSTASNFNNVNVECLIHLTNSLLNPNVSFGIRFPNANEDTRQSIFTVLDTTNQSVMTQQAISLLILNTFSNVQASNGFTNASAYLDVLTSQLTNWVSQISQNFDMGIHYKPGDALSNEQLQIALKTQLFDNRLTLETNLGMINSPNTSANASNIVGEFDLYWKISEDGKLQAHVYNHSNSNNYLYNYTFDKLSPYTQGLGLSYSHSFNRFRDIFKKKRKVQERPIIDKQEQQKQ